MKAKQKYTPKYWVGHDKSTDDVFVETANKAKSDTAMNMAQLLGSDWQLDEDLEIILIEVKMVVV